MSEAREAGNVLHEPEAEKAGDQQQNLKTWTAIKSKSCR